MKKNILFAVSLSVLASPLWAQETDAQAPQPAEAAAPVTEAAAAEQPVSRTVGEFEAWTVTCSENGDAGESCLARQQIALSEQENGPTLTVFLEKAAEDAPLILTVGTPTGVAIQPGVSLILSESDKARVWYAPFESCLQTMCIASAPVNESILSGAAEPAAAFSLANYELVGVKFDTKGMDEAVKALIENAPAPAVESQTEAPAPQE